MLHPQLISVSYLTPSTVSPPKSGLKVSNLIRKGQGWVQVFFPIKPKPHLIPPV